MVVAVKLHMSLAYNISRIIEECASVSDSDRRIASCHDGGSQIKVGICMELTRQLHGLYSLVILDVVFDVLILREVDKVFQYT
jgi:hypothetical protein